MSSGKAQFSGAKTVTVDNVDSRVKEVLKRFIPVLFDEDGNEHEDYALAGTFVMPDATSPTDKSVYGMTVDGNGILAEIQGAVWMASRTITDLRKMNSAADTKRELHILAQGNWIHELEARLTTRNIDRISDEVWWEIVKLKAPTLGPNMPLALTADDFTLFAANASNSIGIVHKSRNSESVSEAAEQLTARVVGALRGNESALGFSLASFSARQKEPSSAVKLLSELGCIAKIFLGYGTWRNKLAKAKKAI